LYKYPHFEEALELPAQFYRLASDSCRGRQKDVDYFPTGLFFPDFAFSPSMTVHSENQFFDLLLPILEKLEQHILAMTKDLDDAKDIVSASILHAFDSLTYVQSKGEFEFYMFKTARTEFFKSLRRKKKFVRLTEEYDDIEDASACENEARLDVELMFKHIDLLPLRQKETLSLFEIAGFSIDEIRKIQGGTLSGVKTRLARARTAIADRMREHETRSKAERGAMTSEVNS
jgi:RNA polymerase sigma-70 factor (ECF subfamily)